MSIQYFIESAGAALAPLMAGMIAVNSTLRDAILIISIAAWGLCSIALVGAAYLVPRDIRTLRSQMQQRAAAISSVEG